MLHEYENTLRHIIISMLGSSDNVNYGISSDKIDNWKRKREEERKRYKGVTIEERLIYYSEFHDLETIITNNKNWEIFHDILGEKKRFQVFYKEVSNFRNSIAHSRSLFSGQEDLLSGIVWDLKNKLVQYHNRNMKVDDFFVRIIKISDSIGNIVERNEFTYNLKNTDSVLYPGSEIEIFIDAFDPKDREIYCFAEIGGKQTERYKYSDNRSITIKIPLEQTFVKDFQITVHVITDQTGYENHDWAGFVYAILPNEKPKN